MKKITAVALCTFQFAYSDAAIPAPIQVDADFAINNGLIARNDGVNRDVFLKVAKIAKNKIAKTFDDVGVANGTIAQIKQLIDSLSVGVGNAVPCDGYHPVLDTAGLGKGNHGYYASCVLNNPTYIIKTLKSAYNAADATAEIANNEERGLRGLFGMCQENYIRKNHRYLTADLPDYTSTDKVNAVLETIYNDFPVDKKNEDLQKATYIALCGKGIEFMDGDSLDLKLDKTRNKMSTIVNDPNSGTGGRSIQDMSIDECISICNDPNFETLSELEQAAYIYKITTQKHVLNRSQFQRILYPVVLLLFTDRKHIYFSNIQSVFDSQLQRIPVEFLVRCPVHIIKGCLNTISRFTEAQQVALAQRKAVLEGLGEHF